MAMPTRTVLCLSVLAALHHAGANAQTTSPAAGTTTQDISQAQPYAIAAGELASVLQQISRSSSVTLVIADDLLQGRRSAGVQGRFTPEQALAQALQGTGLELARSASGAYTARPAPAASTSQGAGSDASTLPQVLVQAAVPSATTQGSGSYTSPYLSIGKGLTSLRETPYSITVVTRQQMDEQNAASLGDAMAYVTGIRTFSTTTGVVNLRSRGFRLNNYLVDGQPMRGGQGMWGSALMDVALYDRVEVWRGPAGLLEGAGEPSGTINLARKRAFDGSATRVHAQLGSWNKRRVEADINRTVTDDGRLSARLVAAWDDRDSFVDVVTQNTKTLYGTLTYALTPQTKLAAGYTLQSGNSIIFAGLPLIAGGITPDYDRSTFLGSRNSTKDDRGYSSFAEISHRTESGGTWLAQFNQYATRNTMNRFISNSMVDPVTREVTIEGAWQKSRQTNQGFDTYYTQPFMLGDKPQEFTVGMSYQLFKGREIQQRGPSWRQNVDHPDHDISIEPRDLGPVPEPETRDRAIYGNLKLRPHQDVLLIAGARLAWWDTRTPDNSAQDQSINSRFVPNFGIVYDLHPEWSAYASYNRIFSPQTERSFDGDFLSPRTGKQVEVGIKGELLQQRLNTQLAVFRINDKGRAMSDLNNEGYSVAAGHVRSQGWEAQVSGQVTPSWNVQAGYAYTQTKHLAGTAANQGRSFDSTFPKHQFSLWTRYQLPQSWLPGAYVGGGMRTSGKTFAEYGGVRWQQGGFSVVTLQAGYEWQPGWNATLTINNVGDRSYFERFAGGNSRQTNYGEPRNITLSVNASF